jgi:hypothetical protein
MKYRDGDTKERATMFSYKLTKGLRIAGSSSSHDTHIAVPIYGGYGNQLVVGRRLLGLINNHHVKRFTTRFETQAELLFERRK